MYCVKCKDKAVIELPRHHSAFCRPHYVEYFDKQVERAVHKHKIFNKEDRILVAVSGGKDSLALWHVLTKMGYKTAGLHIHLGIDRYSDNSCVKARQFAERRSLELITVDLTESYGLNVTQLAKSLRRVPCSGCGLSKRYLLNKEAHERGFDVVATGHNLDDEAAVLLGNILHWQLGYLARQTPVLANEDWKLVKRVKPLYTVTERESAAYAILNDIDYIEEECPNALGAKSVLYKEVLARLETELPGTKQRFLQQFLEKVQARLEPGADEHEIRECAVCGQPTTTEKCAFCRMWQQVKNHRSNRKSVLSPEEGDGAVEPEIPSVG